MKARLISIYALVLLSCAPALIQFNEDEHLVEVFEDITGTQDQLYLKANSWMVETFNNAESVVQHTDKEEGVIIGRYLMNGLIQTSMYGSADSRIYAIIDIRVRDNKARIEIKPQGSWRYDASGMTIYDYSKEDAKREIATLSQDFHNSLMQKDVQF